MNWRDLFTEKDGLSLDFKRVLAVPVALISPLVLQVMAILKGQTFDPRAYMEGIGIVLGGLGLLFGAHSATKGENE